MAAQPSFMAVLRAFQQPAQKEAALTCDAGTKGRLTGCSKVQHKEAQLPVQHLAATW